MIKLRLVGPSADLNHLVYSNKKTGKKGSHIVAIDDDLFDVLEDVVRRRRRGEREARDEQAAVPRAAAPRVESKLPPKDVQRLLRSGRSPDQVAKAAQVPVAWVEQFLGAVQYERAGMVQEVQRSWLEKQRLGVSGAPLGEAVQINLRARHVRMTDAEFADAWDATRVDTQPWTVTLRFRFRGREQRATWRYDPSTREVTAANRLGADLGWVAPGRRLPPARAAAAERAAAAAAAKKAEAAGAKRRSRRSAGATKPASKRAAAKRPTTKRATAKRTAARRPAKRPAARRPAKRAVSKRATARRPAKRSAARRPAKRTVARRPAKRTVARRPAKRTVARRPAKRTAARGARRR